MVWIPIQESDRGEIVARPEAFAYAVSMPDGGGKPITAARSVANPAEVSGAPADAIVVDIHEVGP